MKNRLFISIFIFLFLLILCDQSYSFEGEYMYCHAYLLPFVDDDVVITIDNRNGVLNSYNYFYVYSFPSNDGYHWGINLTSQPVYLYSSDSSNNAFTSINSAYFYWSGELQSLSRLTLTSSEMHFVRFPMNGLDFYSNSYSMYQNSSLSDLYANGEYYIEGLFSSSPDIVEGGEDTGGGTDTDFEYNYTNILTRIDNNVEDMGNTIVGIDDSINEMQNTINDSYNVLTNIDNNVQDIRDDIVGSNQNVVNEIASTSQVTQNLINQQIEQQQIYYNTFTDTNTYNINSTINTGWSNFEDVNITDNFLISMYQTIFDYIDDLKTHKNMQVVIPLPFTNQSFTLDSKNITDFYDNHPELSTIITMLWYVTMGKFIIGLTISLFNWMSNGEILKDTDKVLKEINNSNFIVKDLMM